MVKLYFSEPFYCDIFLVAVYLIFQYCTKAGSYYDELKCSVARNASMMKICDDEDTPEYEKCGYLFSQAGNES